MPRLLRWLPPSAAAYIHTVLLKPVPLRRLAHRVICRLIPEKIQIDDVWLKLNQKDAIVSGNLALGCYETYNIEFFRSLLQPGMSVLDIGANLGLHSSIASALVGPQGKVVAVEPETNNCDLIRETKRLNGFDQLHVLECAVSEQTGEAKLYPNEENNADHRLYDHVGDRRSVVIRHDRLRHRAQPETGTGFRHQDRYPRL